MKTITKTLGSALLLIASTPALAAETENFEAKTTRDLVMLCSVTESHDLHGAAMGYCLGFVDAATDYHAVVANDDLLAPVVCLSAEVTRRDVVDALVAWAKNNDALLDQESPINGLMRAAAEKWPCD